MSEAIVVAVISGCLTLAGTVATCLVTGKRQAAELDKRQAVTDVKIDELTREVREHNNFAHRMPVVEEQIKVINPRLQNGGL